MKNERRINIRVSPETFDAWDKRRFAEKRSWQDLGEEFFGNWFHGTRPMPDSVSSTLRPETNRTEHLPEPPDHGTLESAIGILLDIKEMSARILEAIQGESDDAAGLTDQELRAQLADIGQGLARNATDLAVVQKGLNGIAAKLARDRIADRPDVRGNKRKAG